MCLIIWKTPGKQVNPETLWLANHANPDGIGIMYYDGESIGVEKYLDYDAFEERYWEIEDRYLWDDVLIHFRLSTHGETNFRNCHPHKVHSGLWMMHNGIIPGLECPENKLSDTALFAKRLKQRLNTRFILTSKDRRYCRNKIGKSKLAFMDKRGEVTLINEQDGYWHEGLWYSNYNWVYRPFRYHRTSLDSLSTESDWIF